MRKLLLILATISIIVFSFVLKEFYKQTPLDSLESASKLFDIYSYVIGDTVPIISIAINDKEDETELKKYLKKTIKKSELNNYSIEIYKRSHREEMKLYYSPLPPLSKPS